MSSDGGGAVLKTAGSDFEEGAVLEGQRGALESTRSSTPGRCSRGGSADGGGAVSEKRGGGAPCSAALRQDSRRSSMRLAMVFGHSSDRRERRKCRERE
ncbi:hypothetical protein M6B38_102630 [Iris pallida]|nr:hypothetical protein M6B38_102625 [Iris pallida]KAJ6824308.1 hypothetical protein M6B38_102630 [Iris pallida]